MGIGGSVTRKILHVTLHGEQRIGRFNGQNSQNQQKNVRPNAHLVKR